MQARFIYPDDGTLQTVSRYDLLLALLPIPLLVGVAVGAATSMPVAFGAGLGGVPSALLLGYGLFRAAPGFEGDYPGGRDRSDGAQRGPGAIR